MLPFRRSITAFLAGVLCLGLFEARAEDLGVRGTVWEITEPDLVETLKDEARRSVQSGKWKDVERRYHEAYENKLLRPAPTPGITPVTTPRVFTWDPTYTVPDTIKDHLGNIIAPAGTRTNPLEYVRLTRKYLFVDGRDAAQVEFARRFLKENPTGKVTFTGGSWLNFSREIGRQVYYDTDGALTRRLHISHVPSLLSQKGKLIQVEEIRL